MISAKYHLSDTEWQRISPILIGHAPKRYHLRDVLNAILYVIHTDCPWRKLPPLYPKASAVFNYYQRWQKDGTLSFILAELASFRYEISADEPAQIAA